MTSDEDPTGETAADTLQKWIDPYRQLPLGDASWAYTSFADLVAQHGRSYEPAAWPMREGQLMGHCFSTSRRWAAKTGWTYVEGFVLVPSAIPFSGFDHAWCLQMKAGWPTRRCRTEWPRPTSGCPSQTAFARNSTLFAERMRFSPSTR
ncbi:hypothetical protein ACIP4Y_35670 [Streptomyces sp. NPDC088810]|uniref:hypothetical protein n=1 Tax=Streptomyces sp. NPDC088810 TaxID=3365904 RepID=UPI0037F970D0